MERLIYMELLFRKTKQNETEWFEADNLDKIRLTYDQNKVVVAENEHGSFYDVTELSEIEVRIITDNLKLDVGKTALEKPNTRDLAIRQIELQERMQASGLNIVTCGHCGHVLIHEIGDETIDCFCGQIMALSDCPDYWYRGMENNEVQ